MNYVNYIYLDDNVPFNTTNEINKNINYKYKYNREIKRSYNFRPLKSINKNYNVNDKILTFDL